MEFYGGFMVSESDLNHKNSKKMVNLWHFLLTLSREKLRTNWFYREKKGCYDVPLGNQGDTSWDFGQ